MHFTILLSEIADLVPLSITDDTMISSAPVHAHCTSYGAENATATQELLAEITAPVQTACSVEWGQVSLHLLR